MAEQMITTAQIEKKKKKGNNQKIKAKMRGRDWVKFAILVVVAIAVLAPIFLVIMNSFKGKLYLSAEPFAFPNAESFVGLDNYINGVEK